MGIWLELGIFIVILIAALWQLHDVKRALAKTRARKRNRFQPVLQIPIAKIHEQETLRSNLLPLGPIAKNPGTAHKMMA